ncbi:MAG: anti-sigma factor [Pseudomonadota bacterium]
MSEKLSAYLDGELSADEAATIDAALASDPDLMRELESLLAADTLARDSFQAMVEEPVPLALASTIRNADTVAAPPPQRSWTGIAAAAAVACFVIGGAAGFFVGQSETGSSPGWLASIADYHGVYAAQGRHLVEVPAEEADHIQTWLTATIGADVRIPDLSAEGLRFQGARLVVAAGKPVAQLMYTDGNGRVVALCQIGTAAPQDGFATTTLNGFDMVSWGGREANFVVIGDEGRPDLVTIAEIAAAQV